MTSIVSAQDLSRVYGEGDAAVTALNDVTVEFPSGAFTAIMGPSGSGKSTLMHLLAGLDTATSGHAFIGDTEVTGLNDNALTQLRRDRVGFVFQSFNLLPMFTAEQNITLPVELAGGKVDRAWFETLVRTLGLEARLSHRPSELSGGQQQRVAIARALIAGPEVVFADEPTGNLDSRSGAEVLSLDPSLRRIGRHPLGASCLHPRPDCGDGAVRAAAAVHPSRPPGRRECARQPLRWSGHRAHRARRGVARAPRSSR